MIGNKDGICQGVKVFKIIEDYVAFMDPCSQLFQKVNIYDFSGQ